MSKHSTDESMRATVTLAQLKTAVKAACSAADESITSNPALKSVTVSVHEGNLVLLGVGLDRTSEYKVTPSSQPQEGGSLTVTAKLLTRLVKTIGGGLAKSKSDALEVEVSEGEGELVFAVGKTKFTVRTIVMNAAIPSLDEDGGHSFFVDTDDLARLMNQGCSTASADWTSPVLNSVFLEVSAGELTANSTDRFCVYRESVPVETDAKDSGVIPASWWSSVKSSLIPKSRTLVTFNEKHLTLGNGSATYKVSYAEGQYPNIDSLFPSDFIGSYDIDAAEMVAALKSMSGAKTGFNPRTNMAWDGKGALTMSMDSGDISVSATLPYTATGAVKDTANTASFNFNYLLRGVSMFSGRFQFGLSHNKPSMMSAEGDSTQYLIMPLRS